MKTQRRLLALNAIAVAFTILFGAPRLAAIAGVGDTVFIVGDLMDGVKWSRELSQWEAVIENTSRQIQKGDELIKLVGDPKNVVQQFINSVPDLMQPVDDAIGLETRQHALAMADDLYFLKSVAVKTYKDANKIGNEYEAFGETVKRDPKRYAHFVLQEAMNARYKKAVANAEALEKKEMDVHRNALAGFKSAKTQSEIEVIKGVIAASQERLDLAHAKATQAKGELDAFRGQLGIEDQQKAEADREWAQKVVEQMRQKALDAYKAQSDTGNAEHEN
jgi:hypothetical protein